uniref:Transposase n=1 Tax=Panagrellus redivivus TaxID=6233 RepID=A0A7E4VND0_PANRE
MSVEVIGMIGRTREKRKTPMQHLVALCQGYQRRSMARRLTSLSVCRLLHGWHEKGQFEDPSCGTTRMPADPVI